MDNSKSFGARVVEVARKELALGVREDLGPNHDSKGRIKEYLKAADYVDPDAKVPWCMAFGSYCYDKAGFDLDHASCSRAEAWARDRDFFYEIEGKDDVLTIDPGDLLILDLNKNGKADHVGVVESVNENGVVTLIEGNYSDKLARVTRDDYSKMRGVIHIDDDDL